MESSNNYKTYRSADRRRGGKRHERRKAKEQICGNNENIEITRAENTGQKGRGETEGTPRGRIRCHSRGRASRNHGGRGRGDGNNRRNPGGQRYLGRGTDTPGRERWRERDGNNQVKLDTSGISGTATSQCTNNAKVHKDLGLIPYKRLIEWNQVEDVKELIVCLAASKEQLRQFLNYKVLKDDWNFELLQIFGKVSQASINQYKVTVLATLRGSQFITHHLGKSMFVWTLSELDKEKKRQVAVCLLQLSDVYMKLFPSSCFDMPLSELVRFVRELDNDDIEEQTRILIQSQRDIAKEIMEEKSKPTPGKINYEPPPNDFHEISTFPDVNDIHLKEKPYIRAIKSHGGYDDGEHYLDVQFRLLREDLVAPLREGIHEIIDKIPKNNRKYSLKVYESVQVLYPICTNDGIIHRVRFDTTNTQGILWQQSRRLKFGSLLCFSNDKFNTIIFATVANRDAVQLTKGILDVRFVGGLQVRHYFQDGGVMQMVESSAYFEAYKHVLEALKQCNSEDIPMQKYIVECSSEVETPTYLRRAHKPSYDLEHSLELPKKLAQEIEILNDASWPSHQETELNDSQLKAFKHALTKEFVVIQGPPGTGKTHVGIRIADALLQNKEYWNTDGKTPMLVVCYTNHALDQFLDGMIKFGYENIIRVGRRANDSMEKYSLYNALKNRKHEENSSRDEFKYLRRAKAQALTDRDISIKEIKNLTEEMRKTQDKMLKGKLIDFSVLRHSMKEEHVFFLAELNEKYRKLNLFVFDIFLQLCFIPPENIKDNEWVEPTITETEEATEQTEQTANINAQTEEGDGQENDHVQEREADKVVYKKENENKDDDDNDDEEEGGREGGGGGGVGGVIPVEGEGEVLVDRSAADINKLEVVGGKDKKEKKMEVKHNRNMKALRGSGDLVYVQLTKCQRLQRISKNMREGGIMSVDEMQSIHDPWELPLPDRWRLYRLWIATQAAMNQRRYLDKVEEYENLCLQVKELKEQEDEIAIKKADVVGMTTTCAARNRNLLESIGSKIVIIEEAAEVLEAHVLTSLSEELEHLILIGDHQQLTPKHEMYELATKYSLGLSLFQRMVNNGMECHTLEIQHRMRPEISKLVRHIYPKLQNHPSVTNYPVIKGVNKNVVFINHHEKEIQMNHTKSKANPHEAMFIKSLCSYFLQQGYNPNQITVLTGYTGQLIQLKNIMPKSAFRDVKVTAVDNFQGEENDIILLSLVRSNDYGSIGFLGTDNRICVALSRAKHGLFVIGNFDLLQSKSSLWRKIVTDVKQMGCFSNSIHLHCQIHPEYRVHVKTSTDFLQFPEGGCTKPCEFRLECGHVCEKACHPKDPDHLEYKCNKLCEKITCESNHRCPRRCHHGSGCGKCKRLVEKRIPECEHTQNMLCYQDPEMYPCQKSCERILLPCKHQCRRICGEDCTKFDCEQKMEKTLPCGHSQMVPCFQDIAKVICNTKCTERRNCGHTCPRICHHGSDCGPCNTQVEKTTSECKHIQEMPCHQDPETFSCQKHCEKMLLRCKHQCKRRCGEDCTKFDCKQKVEKTLPCGHNQIVPCIQDIAKVMCNTKCTGEHDCGHMCPIMCHHGSDCGPCNTRVEKTISECKHIQEMPCHQDPETFSCQKHCERMLLRCKHQCKRGCGEDCTKFDCEEKVEKRLPCGHNQMAPCFQDIAKVMCNTKCTGEHDCGHTCPRICHHGLDCGPCNTQVEKTISECKHIQEMPCHQDPERFSCQKNCERMLLRCKHQCKRRCGEDCTKFDCKQKVEKTLPCGHNQIVPCFQDIAKVMCKTRCTEERDCGHTCSIICHHGSDCGPCNTQVEKTILKCKHIQEMPCHQDPETFSCQNNCERVLCHCEHRCKRKCFEDCTTFDCKQEVEKALPCGHNRTVPCFQEVATVMCKAKCIQELDCGHVCTGTCGICKQIHLHKKCTDKCERLLICSHLCTKPCTVICPPCSKRCENKCQHIKCQKKCWEQCTPCMERCAWKCEHKKCSRLCNEICDRDPCNEPCKKLLKCKHPCIGMCGEVCPNICSQCDADKVQDIFFGNEDKPGVRFVVLEDCNHFFEVSGLDNWIQQDNGEGNNVKLKECPRCKTAIRKSVRYGNIVKDTLRDINEIKGKILQGGSSNLVRMKEEAYQKCRDINEIIGQIPQLLRRRMLQNVRASEILREQETASSFFVSFRDGIKFTNNATVLAKRLVKRNIGVVTTNRILHQAKLLEVLWKLKKKGLENLTLPANLNKDMKDLEEFIMFEDLSEQQLADASDDLEKTQAYLNVVACKKDLKEKQDATDRYQTILHELDRFEEQLQTPGKIDRIRVRGIIKNIKAYQQEFGLQGMSDEDKVMIIRTTGLSKDHWFKCPNGHLYAIGECGDETQKGPCPKCGSIIGGLVDDNKQ